MSAIGNVDPNRIQLNRQARAAYEAEVARRAEQAKLEALEAARAEQLKKEAEERKRIEEERNRRDLERSAARHRQNLFLGPKGWEFIVTPTYEDPFGQRPVTRSEVNPAYFNTPEGKELEKQFQAAEQKAVDKAITDYIAQAKSQGILAKDIKAWYDEKTGMVHVQGSNFEPLTTQVQAQAIAGQPQTTYTLKVPSRSDYKTDAEYQQAQKQYSEAQTKLSYEALQNVTRQLQQSGGGTVTQQMLQQEQSRLLATKYSQGVPVEPIEVKQARAAYQQEFHNYLSQGYVPHYEGDKVTFTKQSEAKTESVDRGTARLNEILQMRELGYGAPVPIFENGKRVGTAYQPLAGRTQYEYVQTDPMHPWKFEKVPISSTVQQQQQQFNPNVAEQAWRISVGLGGQTAAGAADLMAFIVGKSAPVNRQISSGLESFAQATRAATGLEGLSKVYETLAGITGQKAYAYAALQEKSQAQTEVPAIDPISAAAGGIAGLAGSAEGKRAVDIFVEQTQKRPLETALTSAIDFFSLGGGSLLKSAPSRVRPFDYAPDIVGVGEKSLLTEKPATLKLTTKNGVVEEIKAPQPTWSWSVRQEVPVYTKPVKGGELRLAEQPTRRPPDADLKEIDKQWQDYAKIPVAISGQTARTFEATENVRQKDNVVTSKAGNLIVQQEQTVSKGDILMTQEQIDKAADAALSMSTSAETTAESTSSTAAKIMAGESLGLGGNAAGYTPTGPLGLGGLTGAERKRFKRPDENLGESNLVYPQQTPDFIKSLTSVPAQQNENNFMQDTKRLADQALNSLPKVNTDTISKLSTSMSSLTAMSTLPESNTTQQVQQAFRQIQESLSKQSLNAAATFKFDTAEITRTKTRLIPAPAMPPSVKNYYFGTRKRKKGINYQERLWHLGKVEDLLFTGKYQEEPFWNW